MSDPTAKPGRLRRLGRRLSPSAWIRFTRIQRKLPGDVSAVREGLIQSDAQLSTIRENLEARAQLNAWRYLQKLPPIGGNGFRYPEITILGSGPSLLELTEGEREVLRSSPTIAMNRFLVFWNLLQIWPAYVFLADTLGVARLVFDRSARLALESDNPPLFLLERAYQLRVPDALPAIYFNRPANKNSETWGETLEDRLYSYRGSLTTLLNLCAVLRFAPIIRLLGVDLDRPGSFYDSARAQSPELFNPWDDEAARQGVHATMAAIERWGGSKAGTILDRWTQISEFMAARGMTIVCGGPSSLLVKRGLCKVHPLEASSCIATK